MSNAEVVNREEMQFDFLIIGGGAAGLAAAYQIAKRARENGQGDLNIAVVEKGSEIGAHSLSGAVLNPAALLELIPNFKELGCPIEAEVNDDAVVYLGESFSWQLPVTPAPFHNKGNLLISLSKFNRWLATQCEGLGVNIFPGFAGVEVLRDGDKVVGVRTGDKGIDKNGNRKANFEPGFLLKAPVTLFAEGTRGSLFKVLARDLNLREGKNPEVFEEGVKEIIQMPPGTVVPGKVIHTLGYPLKKAVGGSFIYTLSGDRIALGLVTYLDSRDPLLDPHRELQKLKTHPYLQKMLAGGKVVSYGGKTLPAGGWYSMPELAGNGWMVSGDSASLVDVQKLKGIHLAMKSGMLAADIALEAIRKQDYSAETLKAYSMKLKESFVGRELYRVRNFHQTLSLGLAVSLPLVGLQEITGGRGLIDEMKAHLDAKTTRPVLDVWGGEAEDAQKMPAHDGVLFFDKLSSVFLTGTSHDEDSPNHLLLKNGDICSSVCEPQYKSPCTHFCPAKVYEMIPSSEQKDGLLDLKINYTNCIHCKTCDIKCPFENIEWTVPEGGGGPKYQDV